MGYSSGMRSRERARGLTPMDGPRKLSASEKLWVADLERVLLRAPPTLMLAAWGDKRMDVWCAERIREMNARDVDVCDGGACRYHARVAGVESACAIDAVAV